MFASSGTDENHASGKRIDVMWPFTCRCGPSDSTSIVSPSSVARRTIVFDQLRAAANASRQMRGRPMYVCESAMQQLSVKFFVTLPAPANRSCCRLVGTTKPSTSLTYVSWPQSVPL